MRITQILFQRILAPNYLMVWSTRHFIYPQVVSYTHMWYNIPTGGKAINFEYIPKLALCLFQLLLRAPDDVTVGEIKQ